uniref:hypothetical protein n=1 Tax=Sphingomonas sp. GlSt437 TaxID=3389970 RepID=UPI003A841519
MLTMKLDFIPLDKLVVSKANMRYGRKAPDVSDILPTVRSRGVIQPVIVAPIARPMASRSLPEAAASMPPRSSPRNGARRAIRPEPMPCAILDDGDDAAAIEASMIEKHGTA